MTALHDLQELGQSIWHDDIHRSMLTEGTLARYVDELAVTGLTSNPTIFAQAVAGSDDYDDILRDAAARGETDPEAVFWDLAIRDIQDAADVLRGVHDGTKGADGFVSLELPPRLSHDTAGSVDLAVELASRVDRPNLMIKVPGTPEGVGAIEELTHRDVNVNVTLLFSLPQWRAVAEAYARGLERRRDDGLDLAVASVASFFVSRIDVKANDRVPDELTNQVAIANSQLAYAAYREWLASDRWQSLAADGARPQRLLWASTSTKDPDLDPTTYVRALAAPDTVNTMPLETLEAVAALDALGATMDTDTTEAERIAARAAEHGADLEEMGEELQREGDRKFADSFDELIDGIRTKLARMAAVA